MERYPNISDHGLIGDLQTAALVSAAIAGWFVFLSPYPGQTSVSSTVCTDPQRAQTTVSSSVE